MSQVHGFERSTDMTFHVLVDLDGNTEARIFLLKQEQCDDRRQHDCVEEVWQGMGARSRYSGSGESEDDGRENDTTEERSAESKAARYLGRYLKIIPDRDSHPLSAGQS